MKNIAANAGCGCGWGMKERWLEEERRGFKYLLVLRTVILLVKWNILFERK